MPPKIENAKNESRRAGNEAMKQEQAALEPVRLGPLLFGLDISIEHLNTAGKAADK